MCGSCLRCVALQSCSRLTLRARLFFFSVFIGCSQKQPFKCAFNHLLCEDAALVKQTKAIWLPAIGYNFFIVLFCVYFTAFGCVLLDNLNVLLCVTFCCCYNTSRSLGTHSKGAHTQNNVQIHYE